MKKAELRRRLGQALSEAVAKAKVGSNHLPPNFAFELHGAGSSGVVVDAAGLIDHIHISDDEVHKLIDIGLKSIERDHILVFVRVSDLGSSHVVDIGSGIDPFHLIEPLRLTDNRMLR